MSINVSMFFGFHDSGVAFSSDAKILLCLQAERIFRKKHMRATSNQLEYLVAIGLKELNLSINEIDTLFIGRWGCEPTSFIHLLGRRFAPVWTAHHANHIGWAKSVGWESGFAVCADGGSENGCSGIYKFNSGGYEPIADLDSTILTGKYYGAITQLLFDVDPESAHVHLPGKTMGIAAFGSFDPILAKHILTQVDGGAIHTERISKIADFLQFKSSFDSRDRRRWNFAHTAQAIWETQWLETLAQFCPAGEKLIFSGGCALNVQLNARLRHSGLFADLFIPPTPGMTVRRWEL
ncbi:hypothetical protein MF410_15080 [Rhizobium sp. C104]|uniref:carbamoyltransferase N-terminal domain-containing protein n=1 Tax=Rhizobium sp. C104 TaxID=2917727 RepID=UPI001EF8C237|nr:carbamoyltransferase N-terminal domain-containing protein [Rhizobium sp. C104]ULJ77368.1 hypothetical protein MF410_15080 [Rhizobium sp. C104]